MAGFYSLLEVREGSLKQVSHILLDEELVVRGVGRVQSCCDLPLLHQVKHVGQNGCVHGQPCRTCSPKHYYRAAISL